MNGFNTNIAWIYRFSIYTIVDVRGGEQGHRSDPWIVEFSGCLALQADYQDQELQLEELKKEFDILKQEKVEYEALQAKYKALQDDVDVLQVENRALKGEIEELLYLNKDLELQSEN